MGRWIVLQTLKVPDDLAPGRKVQAEIIDYGYEDDFHTFVYQVDCPVKGQDGLKSFIVRVPIDESNDRQALVWIQRFRVILDEQQCEPAYLLLDSDKMIVCTKVNERFAIPRTPAKYSLAAG